MQCMTNLYILHIFQITHRTLAAQLCGIFVTVEKDEFDSRLELLLPLLLKQFYAKFYSSDNTESGKFIRLNNASDVQRKYSNLKDPEKMKDHHLFQVLQLLLKMSAHCTSFLTNEKYNDFVCSFAGKLFLLKQIVISKLSKDCIFVFCSRI